MLSGIQVSGLDTAKEAAKQIYHMGVKNVVITMGSLGAVVYSGADYHLVPAHAVQTVDSTAAGDVFNGALAVSLSEGKELLAAVKFACEAAAISVTRLGAQSSIPYRNELITGRLIID
jgi:ribokinase